MIQERNLIPGSPAAQAMAPPTEEALGGGGVMSQLGHGFIEPGTSLIRGHQSPDPVTGWEHASRFAGRIAGWGTALSLTAGAVGAAALKLPLVATGFAALKAAPKIAGVVAPATMAQKATAWGAWGAARAWGEGEDEIDSLLEAAGMGMARSLAITGVFGAGAKALQTPGVKGALFDIGQKRLQMQQKLPGPLGKVAGPTARQILEPSSPEGVFTAAMSRNLRKGVGGFATEFDGAPTPFMQTIERIVKSVERTKFGKGLYDTVPGYADLPVEQKMGSLVTHLHKRAVREGITPEAALKETGEAGAIFNFLRQPLNMAKRHGMTPEGSLRAAFTGDQDRFNQTLGWLGDATGVDVGKLVPKPSVFFQTGKAKKEVLTDRFSKMTLGEQLQTLTGKIDHAGQKAREAIGGEKKLWKNYQDDLFRVRQRMMPQVSTTLEMGREGYVVDNAWHEVYKPLLDRLREGHMENLTSVDVKRWILDEVKRGHGVSRMDQLPKHTQDLYRRIITQIDHEVGPKAGIPKAWTMEDSATVGQQMMPAIYSHTGDAKGVVRELGLFLKDPVPMTSKEVMEMKHPRLGLTLTSLLAPTRKVVGEKLGREIRTAHETQQAYAMSTRDTLRFHLEPWLNPKKAPDQWWYDAAEREIPRALGMPQAMTQAARKEIGWGIRKAIGEYVQRDGAVTLRSLINKHVTQPDRLQKGEIDAATKAGKEILGLTKKMDSDFGMKGSFVQDVVPKLKEFKNADEAFRAARVVHTGAGDDFSWLAHSPQKDQIYDAALRGDIWDLAQNYLLAGKNKMFVQPLDKTVKAFFKYQGIDKDNATHKYWDRLREYMEGGEPAHNAVMEQSAQELTGAISQKLGQAGLSMKSEMLPGVSWEKATSDFIVRMLNLGALGGNVYSGIRNVTQQLLSVFNMHDNPLVGMEYWWKAMLVNRSPMGKILQDLNPVMKSRTAFEGMKNEFALSHRMGKDDLKTLLPWSTEKHKRPGFGELFNRVEDSAMWFFRSADRFNVQQSFMMKYLQATEDGSTFQQAMLQAEKFTQATQFMYGIDSPELYRHPIGKVIGLFSSWPINMAHLVKDQMGQAPIRAATTLSGMALASEALSRTGLCFRSMHPVTTAEGLLPYSVIHREAQDPMAVGMIRALGDAAGNIFEGDPQARREGWSRFGRDMGNLVPFFTAGRRVFSTIDMYRNQTEGAWTQYDEAGRIRSQIQPEDLPYEALIRLIGPSAADRRRWEEIRYAETVDQGYRTIRREALDAYLNGDYETFRQRQVQLAEIGAERVISEADIEQEIELRRATPLERRIRTLPEELRGHVRQRTTIP